jgi:uncharacterized membrane protein YeiB
MLTNAVFGLPTLFFIRLSPDPILSWRKMLSIFILALGTVVASASVYAVITFPPQTCAEG